MEKYSKYNQMFTDYKLTELLTTVHKGKKKAVANNFAVYTLVSEILLPYGIHLWGGYNFQEGTELRHCNLDSEFPEENFPILQQMYGWDNAEIYICLTRTEDSEYGFYFNTESLKIRVVQLSFGDIVAEKSYYTFSEFWAEREENGRNYSKILKVDYNGKECK